MQQATQINSSNAQSTAQPGSLSATGLRKSYGGRMVVQDVSLSVQSGEVVGLLGPNGAGKTTSFYMIVGLIAADAGRIEIDDTSITTMPIHKRARRGLSYLPQDASVFRRLTVEENIRAVLELQIDNDGRRFALMNDFSVASWVGNASLISQILVVPLPRINGALRHSGVPAEGRSLYPGWAGPCSYK